MTTSTSNAQADVRTRADLVARPAGATEVSAAGDGAEAPRTIWSRFIILMLCLAVVMTTLAFGTVHAWSLAAFELSAGIVFALWMVDAFRTGALRVSRNLLQLPLLGLLAVGLVQLMPLGGSDGALSAAPHQTRMVLAQLAGLSVYFAAALAFIDSPSRLKLMTRVVVIFGFLLAVYGLMQHFVNPQTIFWVREPKQANPFGPYVNRHHFAGYMELTLAMPLGLLFAGAVGRERVPLYAFASLIMAVALVMTNSRGGMLSMVCEIIFLTLVAAGLGRRGRGGEEEEEGRGSRARAALVRVGLGFLLIVAVVFGALYFGGEESLSRLVGTVNSEDPTTGRAHFWRGTVGIVKDHPLLGTGLGSFPAAYPLYDTASGSYRLEQAHNDYLQILSDAGVVGGLLGLAFLLLLFGAAVRRMQSHDRFRRGVALGALAGCAGALVHSFFDFTLHTTANALMFLLLAALATVGGRVEDSDVAPRRRRRRRRRHEGQDVSGAAPEKEGAAA